MRRRRSALPPRLPRCVLDSGGLSALIDGSQHARAGWVVEHQGSVLVPTPVLVETITGEPGRDAEVNRVLGAFVRAGGVLVAPDEGTARRAGALRFRARTDDGIDALVAAAALGDGGACVLLTSDPDDLSRLLQHAPQVAVRVV
ncbi:MAG: PIN domain-containing protein [Deltaproteobacteria bacterium]|nr:PIN domain-containing protein [Deltaproteobacteria bacterium]